MGKYRFHPEKLRNNIRKTTDKPVRCIETRISYPSVTQAAKDTGAATSNICKACNEKHRTSGGYHWEYVEDDIITLMALNMQINGIV